MEQRVTSIRVLLKFTEATLLAAGFRMLLKGRRAEAWLVRLLLLGVWERPPAFIRLWKLHVLDPICLRNFQ